jgi:hypothetical protein
MFDLSSTDNDNVPMESGAASIQLRYAGAWWGDPRLGRYRVSIDGVRAGILEVGGTLLIPCSPGSHSIKVSQWAIFGSPPLQIEAAPGETVRLKAYLDKSRSFLRRFWLGLAHSRRLLTLETDRSLCA